METGKKRVATLELMDVGVAAMILSIFGLGWTSTAD
jgi:hypothetical protein